MRATGERLAGADHGRDLDAGSDVPSASPSSVTPASPSGNGSVTGSVSVKMSPPPGRGRAARVPPTSAACSDGDREAEPGASAATRRIGLVEAVEQARQRVLRHAGTAVGHDDHDTVAGRGERDLDRCAGRVVAGVVDEVAEDPVEAPRIGVDHHRLPRDRHRRPREPGRDHAGDDPPEVDGLQPSRASASASKREISMRSSTSARSRRTSATSSSAARRASGESRVQARPRSAMPRRRARSAACAARATRRPRTGGSGAATASSRPTVVSSESAMRLNSAAQRPNSSRPPSGTRAARSPPAIRLAASPAGPDRAQDPARDRPGCQQRHDRRR